MRGDGGRLVVVLEGRDVSNAAVVADDHDLGALADAAAVVTAGSRTAARPLDGVDDLADAAPFADGHGHQGQSAGERHRLERVLASDDCRQYPVDRGAAGEAA